MTKFSKIAMCLGLLAVTGCTSTWQGMKEDWHETTDGMHSTAQPTAADTGTPVSEERTAGTVDPVIITTQTTTYNN